MFMKKLALMIPLGALIILLLYFMFRSGLTANKGVSTQDIPSGEMEEQLLGGDRDEHGCIPSAGYSWCEAKQKCIRPWEESCIDPDASVSEEELAVLIKQMLIAKHGSSAETLDVGVSKISGNYAQGSASEAGLGGGMWFATDINGEWELVWDGNGIIECESLNDYPDFPNTLIPECFDKSSNEMVER
jgi:hypothetical protein